MLDPPHDDAAMLQPGPRVVRLFGTTLAGLWLIAWWSWGIQAMALVGSRGLLPMAEFFAHARATGSPSPWEAPSIFWLEPQDGAILLAIIAGMSFSVCAACGVGPRLAIAASALLYISFIAPATPFMPVLADRLLLEATGLMVLLPRDRPAPAMLFVARAILFKLYMEMGLAQWFAPAGDWQHGLALSAFLESTPMPTPLGWYAAHLPDSVLSLATRVVVFVELFAPWLIFGPRRTRLIAAVALTLLQLGVGLLANYGLFAWVAIACHFFLLAETDVARLEADLMGFSPLAARAFARATGWLRGPRTWGLLTPLVHHARARAPKAAPALRRSLSATLPIGAAALYLSLSVAGWLGACSQNANAPAWLGKFAPLAATLGPWHLVNTYGQLGTPALGREEPRLEAMVHNAWQPVELWHQPGDPWHGPKFVAPHQPRLDVELSAYGRRGQIEPVPHFVGRLMEALCDDPAPLARLLVRPLQSPPQAVRLSLWSYRFAAYPEARDAGVWWQAERKQTGPTLVCKRHND